MLCYSNGTDKNELDRCQIAKISTLLQEIDITENDGDNRFRIGSIPVYVHAQTKMPLKDSKYFFIFEIFSSYRKPEVAEFDGVIRISPASSEIAVSVHAQ